MTTVVLGGCTATPFGHYLKALGVLRLVASQADPEAEGWWDGNSFQIRSKFDSAGLVGFFLERYEPTPIVAPWNGGSGFYPKDNREGIDAIARSSDGRFAAYREAIRLCRSFPELADRKEPNKNSKAKSTDEEERRSAILRRCRNILSDRAVEWLDAAVGIAADGSRAFAPVLGTGGNEGRLDYTNNFMSRLKSLLISPDAKTPVADLLRNSLLGARTLGMQTGAAGQFDPGRAGGANQGMGISNDSVTNPWDLVLTLEGAVAWASGLHRRQGSSYRSILCSPFTVRARRIGYGSASAKDDARAEVWTPLWARPVRYPELKTLLREGRASIEGRPAENTLEFAEAASSLGVDRGISKFVRYSLLKRRGDSYVALPTGTFVTGYRTDSDRVREFHLFFEGLRLDTDENLRRGVEAGMYQALLTPGRERMREMMAALGRLLRPAVSKADGVLPRRGLRATEWLATCGFEHFPEVRIAAALASVYAPGLGSLSEHLLRKSKSFAWTGSDLAARMLSVVDRRLQISSALESAGSPWRGSCAIHPGDVTLFIEGSVDDQLIEDLLFAFSTLDWEDFRAPKQERYTEILPVYAVLKHLFLPEALAQREERPRLLGDPRIPSLLLAGLIEDATGVALARLRVAGLRPLDVAYGGGVDARRLGAALLIPVWPDRLGKGVLHKEDEEMNEDRTEETE